LYIRIDVFYLYFEVMIRAHHFLKFKSNLTEVRGH